MSDNLRRYRAIKRNCPGITKLERFLYCKAHLPQA